MIFAMWILLILGLAFFFHQWLSYRDNPNQHVSASINQQGKVEVVLERNRVGHFVADGHINGQAVTFLVDTGATDVNIPGQVAKRLGLAKGRPFKATTANGIITVYSTRLGVIGIDNLNLYDIRASINPNMHTQEILLGMSFLRHLELKQGGETLTMSVAR
jgi:aspartyl protease family protein